MVNKLSKPFAAALLSLCLLLAVAAVGFLATVTVKAFAEEESTDPAPGLDNWLIMADDEDTEYDIPDWTYGAGVPLAAPALKYGEADKAVEYTLIDGSNKIIAENFNSDKFSYYINTGMYADSYRLEASFPSMKVDGVLYKGATFVYEFEVEAVDIGLFMVADEKTGYGNYEWKYNAANRETFFALFKYDISREGILAFTDVESVGYWATLFDPDYAGYTLTYNFSRMNNEKYYKADDINLLNNIESGNNATYTVYFQIEDRNHNPLTAMGDGRYDYFFTVTVYDTVDVPTVNNVTYTGEKLIPAINDTARTLYEVIWSNEDAYINGGEHSVSFKLLDNVHYRWADVDDETADTVTVKFNILPAQNEWIRVPNIVDWQYETFDTNVNRIRAVVKHLDDGKSVKFSVTKADGTAIEGLTNFTVNEDGTVTGNDALVSALNSLKFGEYKLNVAVEATDNYLELVQSVDFRIYKAHNSWADGENDVVLPSWIVGNYNETDNAIVINAAHGQVNIRVEDIDGNVYYNSVEGVNNLNDLGVGKYLVKAWVDETDDFTALAERAFTLEVFDKVGLPWWGTLLITVGALLIAALVLFILWKKGVFQILTGKIVLAIRTRASIDATIASVRAAKMMEEGRKSVAEAKRRERLEEMRKKAEASRAMAPEERAAALAAKAQAEAEKAEKIRARSESMLAKAEKMRGSENADKQEAENADESKSADEVKNPVEQPEVEQQTKDVSAEEEASATVTETAEVEQEVAVTADAERSETAEQTAEQEPETKEPASDANEDETKTED